MFFFGFQLLFPPGCVCVYMVSSDKQVHFSCNFMLQIPIALQSKDPGLMTGKASKLSHKSSLTRPLLCDMARYHAENSHEKMTKL